MAEDEFLWFGKILEILKESKLGATNPNRLYEISRLNVSYGPTNIKLKV